jgi:hypothetical protein
MANVYAVKDGNWSDPTVWDGGTLPTTADDVWANGFTITIDVNATVLSIRNTDLATPIVINAGGTFIPVNENILTCTATTGVVASSTCYTCNLTTEETCTLNANILGGSAAGGAVRNNGEGTLLINGDSNGSNTFNNSSGVINSSTGTITITGNVRGGPISAPGFVNNAGIENIAAGTINLIGNSLGGNSGGPRTPGIYNLGSGTVNVTGVVQGFFIANGVTNESSGTVNIVGSVLGTQLDTRSGGAFNGGIGTINIVGDCTAPGAGPAAVNNGAGTINIVGDCTTTGSGTAATNNGTGVLNHVGIIQSSVSRPAIESGGASQITILTGPFLCASNGVQACIARRWRLNASTFQTYIEVQTNDLAIKRNLYTAESVGGNPLARDVRLGVEYGPNGDDLVGTCIIPPNTAVRAGVAVDDTVGVGDFSANAEEFWDTLVEDLENEGVEGSVGKLMSQISTTQLVGEYLASFDKV